VSGEITIGDIKGLIEAELNVPSQAQNLSRNSQPLINNAQTLGQLNVAEGDLLGLQIRTRPRQNQRSQNARAANRAVPDAETTRLHMLGDARLMERVRQQNPELAAATQDPVRFSQMFMEEQRRLREQQLEQERQNQLLEADPFNSEAQAKIEKIIRDQNIASNLAEAMESNPESFARVTMLYIDVTVNNVPIKAFVDSGAQTTIMSPDAARRCNIHNLIDDRWKGQARGVGTANILGRVHHAYIQLGHYQAASSFTVMEGKDVDLLLGLDMLKKHQMCIDLNQNCLRVQDITIPFLPEHEIPKMMEEVLENEPKVAGPGGATIGATTGTIEAPKQGQTSNAGPSTAPPQPAPAPASNLAPAAQAQALPPGLSEQSIRQITDMGFTREEAIMSLQQANGNVEYALGLLF
jgi:DNA damage-inducible protein 1